MRCQSVWLVALIVVGCSCKALAERLDRQKAGGTALEQKTSADFTVGLEVEWPSTLNRQYYSDSGQWLNQPSVGAGQPCTYDPIAPCDQLLNYGYPWLVSAQKASGGFPKMWLESEDCDKNTLEIVTGPATEPWKSATRIWRLTKFVQNIRGKIYPLQADGGASDMAKLFSKQEATGLTDETTGLDMVIPGDSVSLPESDSIKPSLLKRGNASCFQTVGIKPSFHVSSLNMAPQVNFVMKLDQMHKLVENDQQALTQYFGSDGHQFWRDAGLCYQQLEKNGGPFAGFTNNEKKKGALYMSLALIYMVDYCDTNNVKTCKYKTDLLPKVTLEDLTIRGVTRKGLQSVTGLSLAELFEKLQVDHDPCKKLAGSPIRQWDNEKIYKFVFHHEPPGVLNDEAVVMEARNPAKEPLSSLKEFWAAIRTKDITQVNDALPERQKLKCVFLGLKQFAWQSGGFDKLLKFGTAPDRCRLA